MSRDYKFIVVFVILLGLFIADVVVLVMMKSKLDMIPIQEMTSQQTEELKQILIKINAFTWAATLVIPIFCKLLVEDFTKEIFYIVFVCSCLNIACSMTVSILSIQNKQKIMEITLFANVVFIIQFAVLIFLWLGKRDSNDNNNNNNENHNINDNHNNNYNNYNKMVMWNDDFSKLNQFQFHKNLNLQNELEQILNKHKPQNEQFPQYKIIPDLEEILKQLLPIDLWMSIQDKTIKTEMMSKDVGTKYYRFRCVKHEHQNHERYMFLNFDRLMGDSRFFHMFKHLLITSNGYVSPEIIKFHAIALTNDHPEFVDAIIKTVEDGYLPENFPSLMKNSSHRIFEKYIIKHVQSMFAQNNNSDTETLLENSICSTKEDIQYFAINLHPAVTDIFEKFYLNETDQNIRRFYLELLTWKRDEKPLQIVFDYLKARMNNLQYRKEDEKLHQLFFIINGSLPALKMYSEYLQNSFSVDDFVDYLDSLQHNQLAIRHVIYTMKTYTNNMIFLKIMNADERDKVMSCLIQYPDLVTNSFFRCNKSPRVIEFVKKHKNRIQLIDLVSTILNNPYATELINS